MKTLLRIILLAFVSSANAYDLTVEDANGVKVADWIKWEDISSGKTTLGVGATVSYSFANTDYSCGHDSLTCYSLDDYGIFSGYQTVIESAFDTWASVADLNFEFVTHSDSTSGDIVFGAETMDGTHGTLAHALTSYYPSSQEIISSGIHFDLSENWSLDGTPANNEIDFFTVALHEIGHALGLDHSADQNALMYPSYTLGTVKSLGADDIEGIGVLYGVSAVPEPSTYLLFLLGLTIIIGIGRKQATSASL